MLLFFSSHLLESRSTESVQLFSLETKTNTYLSALTEDTIRIPNSWRDGWVGWGGGVREQAALVEGEEEESNIPVYGGSGPGMK